MDNTIIISDTHFPYHHVDTFAFLKAIKKKYKIKKAIHTGDVVDHHAGSFHDLEYGTLSAKDEHDMSYEYVQQLYKMFPKMHIAVGNHDAIPKRKAKAAGIPEDLIKDYNAVYDTKGWVWRDKHIFKIDRNSQCMLIHSMGTNTAMNAAKHSLNSIQGHHHSKFGLEYYTDVIQIRWSITVGCLIDMHHPAFNYASKATMNRPIIGCGAIINNRPVLIPMCLKANGRWDGTL